MSNLRAVVFDVDGTIAETERDGHRVAFNRAFKEAGIPVEWDVETYRSYLRVGGGKERIRMQLDELDYGDPSERDDLILRIHKRKTEIFGDIVREGNLPIRPGIKRLITEIHNAGLKLAVASTSQKAAVETVIHMLLGEEIFRWFDIILAGDVVSRKKPDPEIYMLAALRLGIEPDQCVVVEDSGIGCAAAVAAGMNCLVTTDYYTGDDRFDGAGLVANSLGDPGKPPVMVISNPLDIQVGDYITLGTLEAIAGQ